MRLAEEELQRLEQERRERAERVKHKAVPAVHLTLDLPAPTDLAMPPATLKQLRRAGFTYNYTTRVWSAWESDEARTVYDALNARQAALF